jgi:hypothetical protein
LGGLRLLRGGEGLGVRGMLRKGKGVRLRDEF